MSNCDKFKMQFSDFLDGELSLAQQKELDDHFKICPECAEVYRQIKIIQQSIRQLPRYTTSPDFEKKLHEQIFNSAHKTSFIPQPLHTWKLPAMGSAIVLATVGLFLVFNSPSDSPQNSTYNPATTRVSSSSFQNLPTSPAQQSLSNTPKKTLTEDTLKLDENLLNQNGMQLVGGQPSK
ncbi:MAG: hypothetical protein Kow0042_04520 [Calditrichia bacterium]